MFSRPLVGVVPGDFPEQGWFKSSYTGPNGGDCVEVNQQHSDVIGVRDSKQPQRAVLAFGRSRWQAFVAAVAEDRVRPRA